MTAPSADRRSPNPRSEPDIAVRAEGVRKRYGTVEALRGVDLEIATGTVLGLLGPNGAGKTTFVRVLSTLISPTGGHATVAGYDVVREPGEVRRRIGLTGQYAAVDEDLTGRENLRMMGRLLGMPKFDALARAAELLEQVSLTDAADRPIKTYSGGMRRRLDLAASLVGRPEIVMLDEPTTGLDPRSRIQLWNGIRSLVAEGTTILLTTQYLEEADQLADRIAVIDGGTVIAEGTATELKDTVGGHVVNVTLADPHAAPIAIAALASISERINNEEANRLVVPVGGADALAPIVRALDDAGVAIADMEFRAPSLDDVFLTLTGKRTAADDESGADDQASPTTARAAGRSGRRMRKAS